MAYVRIRPRRSTKEEWESKNPILSEGEMGIEIPSVGIGKGLVKIKFGDGITRWNNLSYGITNDITDNIIDDDHITDHTTYSSEKLEELFQSVSDGKTLIASAITDKGVPTESDATFNTMAENIKLISGGGGSTGIPGVELNCLYGFDFGYIPGSVIADTVLQPIYGTEYTIIGDILEYTAEDIVEEE